MSEDEYENALNKFRKEGCMPSIVLYPNLIKYINRKKITHIIDRDYDSAENLDKIIEELNCYFMRKNDFDEKSFSKNMKIMELSQKAKDIKMKYKEMMEKLENEHKDNERRRIDKNKSELIAFKAKWESGNMLQKYNHPSNGLLQMRFVEKKLALSKQYKDANSMKKRADEYQKKEEKGIMRIMETKMREELQKLEEKHTQEEKSFSKDYQRALHDLKLMRSREIQPLKVLIRNLQSDSSQTKHQLKYDLSQDDPSQYSPRTFQILTDFKSSDVFELNLIPLSLSKINDLIAKPPSPRLFRENK